MKIQTIPTKRTAMKTTSPSQTKRLAALIAALGLVACVTGVANANDLINGTLDNIAPGTQNEDTPTGWAVDAARTFSGPNADGCSSQPWCNVLDTGGQGLFFKPFQGSATDPLTVQFYQDGPSTPGTKVTLSGYAAGEPNYSGFFATNVPVPATLFIVEFLDGSSTVLASNVYDLVANGLPNGGPGSMALFTTPEFTAPAGTVTVRAGAAIFDTYNTTGGQSFFVDAFDLTSVAPPGSPVITNQPAATTVSPGGNTFFTVGISNPTGASYQWQLYGTNLANGGSVSGATLQTLSITGASASDVGHYRVRVSNGSGAVYSQTAPLALQSINFYPVVVINGKIGDTYRVDYSTPVAPTTWIPLSTNLLNSSTVYVIDSSSPGSNTRFYRSVFLY